MATERIEGRSIVRTESVLGGKPRIEGTRIGIHHVAPLVLEGDDSVEHVVTVTYPELSGNDVLSALAYYIENREEMEAMREQRREAVEAHRRDPDTITGPTIFRRNSARSERCFGFSSISTPMVRSTIGCRRATRSISNASVTLIRSAREPTTWRYGATLSRTIGSSSRTTSTSSMTPPIRITEPVRA
jgi:uncharacterized protein (DUF433 family)